MWALPNAFCWGLGIAALSFLVIFLLSKNAHRAMTSAIAGGVVMFVWEWFAQYVFNVEYVGFLDGYGYRIFGAAIAVGLAGLLALAGSDSRSRSSSRRFRDETPAPAPSGNTGGAGALLLMAAVAAVVLLIGSYTVVWFYYSIGINNNRAWAALGNITVADSKAAPEIPDTDPNEYILLDCHLAYTLAHSQLGNGGSNLGSYYEVNEDECVQQWVNGRNYFVFPLELNGWSEQEGILTTQISTSPGYVAVPADDPEGREVKVVSNLHLKYMPGSYFSYNLQRYVYSHGYSNGTLVDATMELDDNFKPWFTISYVQPAFVVGGNVVVKLLVVDPETGEIQSYDPDKVPAWVDRVNDESMVGGWVGDFAKYHVNPAYWNSNNAGQMKNDVMRLVNVHGQHQVWQIPLLANKDGAISTNGLVLYDTRLHQGTFYEAAHVASGLMSFAQLKGAFEAISQNTQGYHVDHIQWYMIRGVPTWMAIYAKNINGKTQFAGVGFLDAQSSNPADVRFGQSRDQALQAYYQYLDTRGDQGGSVDEQVTVKTVTGTVLAVGSFVLNNNQVMYRVFLVGDGRAFDVSLVQSDLLPGVSKGDVVTITFKESNKPHGVVRTATKFDDATLNKGMTAPAH